jgi:hypothetical protein
MNVVTILITLLHNNAAEVSEGTVFKKETIGMPSGTLVRVRNCTSIIPEVVI